MNLPIKLVDLVTLLFLSILVVIIIFIILQRNIKRFKLRNIKDPHFHLCKSIPKDLKQNIINKHSQSSVFREPHELFTSSYQNLDSGNTKSFVLRMKAFDTSKHLENALYCCGYSKPSGVKFEQFLINLIENDLENSLPKKSFKEFILYYKWILHDPKTFRIDDLRAMNYLINKLIDELSITYKDESIRKYKLELNSNGDFEDLIYSKLKLSNDFRSFKKLNSKSNDGVYNILNSNSANNNKNNKNIQNSFFPFKSKTVFSIKNLTNTLKEKTSQSLHDSSSKLKEDTKSKNFLAISNNKIESDSTNNIISDELNRWSIINESMKTFNESENEENEKIPLVFNRNSRKLEKGNFNEGFSKNFESNF